MKQNFMHHLLLLFWFSLCQFLNELNSQPAYLDQTSKGNFATINNSNPYNGKVNIFFASNTNRCRLSFITNPANATIDYTPIWNCSAIGSNIIETDLSAFGPSFLIDGLTRFIIFDTTSINANQRDAIIEPLTAPYQSGGGISATYQIAIEDLECGMALSYQNLSDPTDKWYLTHDVNITTLAPIIQFQRIIPPAIAPSLALHQLFIVDSIQSYSFSQTNATLCATQCPPGSYYESTSTQCFECPSNNFTNASGLTSCYPCANFSDTLSQLGSTGCNLCDFGSYYDYISLSCSNICPIGKSTQLRGSSSFSACKQCPSACMTCDLSITSKSACLTCLNDFMHVLDPTSSLCILDPSVVNATTTTSSCDDFNCSKCLINKNMTCFECNVSPHNFLFSDFNSGQSLCLECDIQCKSCISNSQVNANIYRNAQQIYQYEDCTSCFDGQYLVLVTHDHGSCLNCPVSCQTCQTFDDCLTCSYYFKYTLNSTTQKGECINNNTKFYPDNVRIVPYDQDVVDRSITYHVFYTIGGIAQNQKCYLSFNVQNASIPTNQTIVLNQTNLTSQMHFYWECDVLRHAFNYNASQLFLDQNLRLYAYLNSSLNGWLAVDNNYNYSTTLYSFAPPILPTSSQVVIPQVQFDRYGCGHSIALANANNISSASWFLARPTVDQSSNQANASLTQQESEKAKIYIYGRTSYNELFGQNSVDCENACPLGSFANVSALNVTTCQECEAMTVGRTPNISKCDVCPVNQSLNLQVGNILCKSDDLNNLTLSLLNSNNNSNNSNLTTTNIKGNSTNKTNLSNLSYNVFILKYALTMQSLINFIFSFYFVVNLMC